MRMAVTLLILVAVLLLAEAPLILVVVAQFAWEQSQ